jgi:hypothetical protein
MSIFDELDREPRARDGVRPGMALARRRARPTACSDLLSPASSRRFRDELTACLALVAPVGMTEEARGEWLAVAWATLRHLPADLLAIGCARARETCDHPARIVPAIVAETRALIARRRAALRPADPDPPAPAAPDTCTPEQARAILEEFGLASRFGGARQGGEGKGDGHGTRG